MDLLLPGSGFIGFRFAPGFEGEAAEKGHALVGVLCSDLLLKTVHMRSTG